MRCFPNPAFLWAFAEFLWRTFLIGLALFIVPPAAVAPTVEQQILGFIGILIWCYYDGLLLPRIWLVAVGEGIVWFIASDQWTQALLYFFKEIEA